MGTCPGVEGNPIWEPEWLIIVASAGSLTELAPERYDLSLLAPTGADALVLLHCLGAATERIFGNLLRRDAGSCLLLFVAALSVAIRRLCHAALRGQVN